MNGPSFLNAMNLGGGAAASGGKSARLFAGLRDELTRLQPVLDKVVQSTQKIAENLTKAKGAGSLGFTGSGGGDVTSLGFVAGSEGMSFGSFARGMARAAAVVGTAATQALDLNEFAENAIARSRYGFFSGQGAVGASMTFQGMMNRGIGVDRLDAARAGLAGTSMGLMPSLPGYENVTAGAEMFSRLVPGAGLTGGMQAVAALNQASTVNRLRMIGIQVRDPATGVMRNPADIANDLWKSMERQKTGSRPITKQDIALSLQSGNSLDMTLNQYFGNDPVLRQGIITELMQRASGGDNSLKSLNETGALPDLAISTGARNAASYNALNAYTGAAEQGMIGANATIATAANTLAGAADTFAGAVTAFTYGMQLSGGAGGALGTLGGGLLGGLANFAGSFLGGKAGGGRLGPLAGSLGFKGASKIIPGVGAAVQGVSSFQQGQTGQGFDIGGTLMSSLVAAGLGFLAGGPGGAALAGLTTFGGSLLGHTLGAATAGEGDGADGGSSNRYNPLEELSINAAWRKKRDYLIDGKPPANPYHTGVDYAAAENTPVFSVKDGVVHSVKDNGNEGFGKSVAVRHADGYTSFYAHLNAFGVKPGDSVKAGQQIGLSGNTGLSSGPHLHFEVREKPGDQKTNVDPVAYISGSSSPTRAADFSASGTSSSAGAEAAGLLGQLSSGVALLPGLNGAPSPGGEGDGGGMSSTTNYGGVTVNINVPKGTNVNEQTLAREIKRVLSDQEMLKKAVTR